jgi:hypothetical protein
LAGFQRRLMDYLHDREVGLVSHFPFGRPATRRPPRVPTSGSAALFVLGVYPSALHIRWRRPDGAVVGALAVDDEPTVFWDGADAAQRIEQWQQTVGWAPEWGAVGAAGGNGSSGRHVVGHVLRPLDVVPEQVYFTDCLPTYFVKSGSAAQASAVHAFYGSFAAAHNPPLPSADLPTRPSRRRLVQRAIAEEGPVLVAQMADAAAPTVVTLGQEAADVLAALADAEAVRLTPDEEYGNLRTLTVGGRQTRWLPLIHPGNRDRQWRGRHDRWTLSVGTVSDGLA